MDHMSDKYTIDVKLDGDAAREQVNALLEDRPVNGRPQAGRLLLQVDRTVTSRRENNGRPLINFTRAALYWSVYMIAEGLLDSQRIITPRHVGMMMDIFKNARDNEGYNPDNILDKIGYMDCVDDMDRELREMGRGGIECLDGYGLDDLRALLSELA